MGTAQLSFEGIDGDRDVTGSYITGTGSREPKTGNEREIISRAFFTRISRVFVPVFGGKMV
jgi:hypothetical protein